jgi:2,3-bisphosphoglycerate-dependent phosphoglycerate mutase
LEPSTYKSLYLVRHCQATGQEPDAPLTDLGFQQAERLRDWFADRPLERIVSSPYVRAYQSAIPLARQCGLTVETDERLKERVFCETPLPDWRERLTASYADLDLCLPGGESSRTAMTRGVAALETILQQNARTTAIFTHGNLLTLLLKHFNDAVGIEDWERMTNPDVYLMRYETTPPQVTRLWSA